MRGPGNVRATVMGYQVCYPDGTCTPKDQPIFSMIEARSLIRDAGGGTVHRLLKEVS